MFLFTIIISPIIRLLEIFYLAFKDITNSIGFSVLGLSFVVTLCCLPLYVVSEGWQEKERETQKKMSKIVKHIKETFSGDERYMMLSAAYKEHNYHPIMALRSSFSLLIQIPFFIAAYTFLSHLPELNGIHFLFIKDMGVPDASFAIGNFNINILPIAMTLFNCISGAIYSKGHSSKEKAQIYISAAVFLVILYNSPSGLVLYWTMNNVLSLVKNIFYKFKNPLTVLHRCVCVISVIGILLVVISEQKTLIKACVFAFFIIADLIPFIVRGTVFCTKKLLKTSKHETFIFLISASTIALLTGLFVPSMLIESEPNNFCYIGDRQSPFSFLATSFFQAIGMFIFWPSCFYFLFNSTIKKILSFSYLFMAFFSTSNAILFSLSYSPLEPTLVFMENSSLIPSITVIVLNAVCALTVLFLAILLFRKGSKNTLSIIGFVAIALIAVSGKNIITISKEYKNLANPAKITKIDPIFHLSKTGKNVLFIMLDRAFMPFVQDIFEEKPELTKNFDGFVFYPNTLSYGQYTIFGTPGLFVGYSYTPHEMNKRTNETLQQKHNEALLSLPVLFDKNGFNSTVVDMPYENFLKHPTNAMYAPYPDIQHKYAKGLYSSLWYEENGITPNDYTVNLIEHNLFMIGLFKACPPLLRFFVYHHEWWYAMDDDEKQDRKAFVDCYSVLDYLPELTDFSSNKNSYIALDSEATHEPVFLQAPEYVPAEKITDYGNSKWRKEQQYHVQAAAFRKLAEYFEFLKHENVYDNTRIIIVSDHGTPISTGKFENNLNFSKEHLVACLLFKDFNAHTPMDFPKTCIPEDMTFMTNADAPALATKDLILNAKNPFTGLFFSIEDKSPYLYFCHPENLSTRHAYETTFETGPYYKVKDNIFETSNWQPVTNEQ